MFISFDLNPVVWYNFERPPNLVVALSLIFIWYVTYSATHLILSIREGVDSIRGKDF